MSGSLGDIVKDVVHDSMEDDVIGEAAKMAYFLFLSTFPLLLVILALTGIIGGEAAFARITSMIQTAAPGYARELMDEYVREITERERPGLLSFGIIFTAWAASTALAALTVSLNNMYGVGEGRNWFKRRAIALAVVASGAVLIVLGTAALLIGMDVLEGMGIPAAWSVVRWPIGLGGVLVAVWLMYYFLPNRDQSGHRWETLIGAVVATLLWALATLGFQLYLDNFGRFGVTYGAIAAVIVLLMWFFLTALAIMIGGEVAAVLERRANPDEKRTAES